MFERKRNVMLSYASGEGYFRVYLPKRREFEGYLWIVWNIIFWATFRGVKIPFKERIGREKSKIEISEGNEIRSAGDMVLLIDDAS